MDLVKTFIEFVKIASPTGEERIFSDHLLNKLKKLGVRTFQDKRGNILVSVKGNGHPLLLAAHIDTVQPGRNIRPVIKNGVIRSSGDTILGADNKAIVSCLFELISFISKNKDSRHRPLEILFSVSEEAGVSGIDTFDFRRVKAKEGLCIDAAQGLGAIITGSPFYISQTIEFIGRDGHTSEPEKGNSVVPAIGRFFSKTEQGRVDVDTLINVGIITGGEATNSLMARALIKSEIRSFSREKLKKHSVYLKSLARKSAKSFGCRLVYEEKLENYGYSFIETDRYIKNISEELIKFVGPRSIKYMPRYGGISDANNLNGKGIKTVNLGYGAKDAHTTRETIKIADLEKVFEFIKAFVAKI